MDNALGDVIKKHGLAFVLAIAIGIVTAAPFLYFAYTPEYAGIHMIGTDAEDHYVARIQEVYNGHLGLGNTFLAQKEQPYFIPPLGEIIDASVGQTLHMTAPEINDFSKLIFPIAATLLIYFLLFDIFSSRATALVGSSIAMLGSNLISGPSQWLALMRGTSQVDSFLNYARPINPEISGLFFMGGIFFLYHVWWKNQQPRLWQSVLLGIIIGSSLYISPFVFSFLVVISALIGAWYAYSRLYRQAAHVALAGTTALIALTPFVYNYILLRISPAFVESSQREGLISGHAPILSWWLVLLTVGVLFAWPKRFNERRSFFILAIASIWILLEQQIATGVSIQPGHFHWYITVPLACLVLGMYVIVITESFLKKPWAQKMIYACLIAFISYNAALADIYSYNAHAASAIAAQRYAPVIAYLNSVPVTSVWASEDLSQYIPMYTHDMVPNNPQIANYLVPTYFFRERLFLKYRLRHIQPDNTLATMRHERAQVSSEIYGIYWREQAGDYSRIPDDILADLTKEYKNNSSTPLQSVFEQIGIKTIVWDSEVNPEWRIDSLPFLKKAFVSGNISVYQIKGA